MKKPVGLSLFNKADHFALAVFWGHSTRICTKNCQVVSDCDLSCKK